MSYPKPLLEKTLKKRYAETGIQEEAMEALSSFFDVCSELYGCISLENAWELYKKLMKEQGAPIVNQIELFSFSEVARRDRKPYCIYTSAELWSDGDSAYPDRFIVNNDMCYESYTSVPSYKVYQLLEFQAGKPFYIPEKFLSYRKVAASADERKLLKFFENLRVNRKTRNLYGIRTRIKNTGKLLKDFRFYNSMEEISKNYLAGREDYKSRVRFEALERKICDNEAQKLVRIIKDSSDYDLTGNPFSNVSKELYEVGVDLNENEVETLAELVTSFINNTRNKSNRGWTPLELREIRGEREMPSEISIGPGIQKLIESGDIDKEELEAFLASLGINPDYEA